MQQTRRNAYAEPHPELIMPAPSFRGTPGAEVLAQIVAFVLLLVACLVTVWALSQGVANGSERQIEQPTRAPMTWSA